MAIQNIECQIATVLMKRYLDGDNLPQNLLDDLEKHLKACSSCQAILNNENASIEEVLDGPAPVKGLAGWMGKLATQPATAGGFVTAGAGEALMSAGYRTNYTPQAPGMAVLKSPKVLFLSLALAAVLIAMSTILRNPANLLGPKASSSAAIYTETSDTQTEEPKDTEKAAEEESHEADTHTKETPEAETHESTEPETPIDSEAHGETHSEEKPKADPAHTSQKKPVFEEVNDPRVPGKPTINNSELIVAGGQKAESKTESHSAPKKVTPAPAKPKATPAKKTTSTPRRTTSKPKTTPKPAPKKTSGSGITVYDENGKPIKN